MQNKPDLAAVISSRICHDLISPIGAIGNGVELLMQDRGRGNGAELGLIAESVNNASAKLRFFRLAFGQPGADQRIAQREVAAILGDLTNNGRLQIEWLGPSDLSRREVKLIFLLLLCLETALPWGGRIVVDCSTPATVIEARAERLRHEEALWQNIISPQKSLAVTPAQVQFVLAPMELAALGRRVTCEIGETMIRMQY